MPVEDDVSLGVMPPEGGFEVVMDSNGVGGGSVPYEGDFRPKERDEVSQSSMDCSLWFHWVSIVCAIASFVLTPLILLVPCVCGLVLIPSLSKQKPTRTRECLAGFDVAVLAVVLVIWIVLFLLIALLSLGLLGILSLTLIPLIILFVLSIVTCLTSFCSPRAEGTS
jgi:hypothetical protein